MQLIPQHSHPPLLTLCVSLCSCGWTVVSNCWSVGCSVFIVPPQGDRPFDRDRATTKRALSADAMIIVGGRLISMPMKLPRTDEQIGAVIGGTRHDQKEWEILGKTREIGEMNILQWFTIQFNLLRVNCPLIHILL